MSRSQVTENHVDVAGGVGSDTVGAVAEGPVKYDAPEYGKDEIDTGLRVHVGPDCVLLLSGCNDCYEDVLHGAASLYEKCVAGGIEVSNQVYSF